jgi:nitrite reductase/ring-hydroxylating ferredoxin subunit
MLLELQIDRAKARYRVRTLAGEGTGTEIWTLLDAHGPHRTAIEVRFYLPEHRPERLAALGEKYRSSYARLWDQDEAMMVRREALSARSPVRRERSGGSLALGPLVDLRARLPLFVEIAGGPFRIIELDDGVLVAHSTICPHWLGPLDETIPKSGILRCPWHGYRFDLRTGASADGRGCRLAPAPSVVVDPVTGELSLRY